MIGCPGDVNWPEAGFCTLNVERLYKLCWYSPDDFDSKFHVKPDRPGKKLLYPDLQSFVKGYDWTNPKTGEIVKMPGLQGYTAMDPLSSRRVVLFLQEQAKKK